MEKRSKNFTQKEKDFLLELVMSQKDIVENKKTDATSIQEEDMCWENITNVYNNINNSSVRSSKQLRELYAFLKRKAIKNLYNDKAEVMKTGGPYTPKCDAQNLKIVAQLTSQFYPDSNPYDSSAQLVDKPPRENSSPQTSCSYTLDNIDHNYTEKCIPLVEVITDVNPVCDHNQNEDENATISQRVELPGRVPKKRRKATVQRSRSDCFVTTVANQLHVQLFCDLRQYIVVGERSRAWSSPLATAALMATKS
ncbi:Myb/SANT-like DNA-binding domain [Popillia japonica]|uniref:Regulatory protein zeste n=1 Tax=Popillia japonica TaxID=7064 RepID=A0AAW1L687_POPJA